jgi:hypothetical protein
VEGLRLTQSVMNVTTYTEHMCIHLGERGAWVWLGVRTQDSAGSCAGDSSGDSHAGRAGLHIGQAQLVKVGELEVRGIGTCQEQFDVGILGGVERWVRRGTGQFASSRQANGALLQRAGEPASLLNSP